MVKSFPVCVFWSFQYNILCLAPTFHGSPWHFLLSNIFIELSLSSLIDWYMLKCQVKSKTLCCQVWIHLLPVWIQRVCLIKLERSKVIGYYVVVKVILMLLSGGKQKGHSLQGSVSNLQEFLKPLGLMELAPRVMKLRNVGSVKLQSSLLECECTCGGKSAKRRVGGPKRREGSVPPRRRAEEQKMERRQAVIQDRWLCGDSWLALSAGGFEENISH